MRTDDITLAMDNPIAVDRSLRQTAQAYDVAYVDIPAIDAWLRLVEQERSSFHWWEYCGSGWDLTRVNGVAKRKDCVPIIDGQYVICLKERDHEGECAR